MPSEDLTVKLANHEYVLEPQPYAYLRFELKKFVSGLTELDTDASDVIGLIGGNAYKLLAVLIPGFMPRYEFEGYSSNDAYERDLPPAAPGEDADQDDVDMHAELLAEFEPSGPDDRRASPTNDQILKAIDTAAKVNRLDLVKQLKGLVDADFLSVILKRLMLEAVGNFLPSGSPSSPPSTASEPSSTTQSLSAALSDTDSTDNGETAGYREAETEPLAAAGS